jgi:membrane dipeptidase
LLKTPQNPPAKAVKLKEPTPEQVHRNALVIDTHEDTPQRFVDEHFDLSDPLNGGQLNLDAIHKGNLGASFMSIWVEPELYKGHYARRTLELIDASRTQAAKHPDQIKFATSAVDIEAAAASTSTPC